MPKTHYADTSVAWVGMQFASMGIKQDREDARGRTGGTMQGGRKSTDQREALRLQRMAVEEAFKDVGLWSLALWQRRGDEDEDPDYDRALATRVALVKSKVDCLRVAYPACEWNDLVADLNALDVNELTLEAVLRLQCFHAPLVRARVAAKPKTRGWCNAVAHEVDALLSRLNAYCRGSYFYDECNYQTEDAILAGLVSGLRDFAQAVKIKSIPRALGGLTLAEGKAPEAREMLSMVILPACKGALSAWCRSKGFAPNRALAKATGCLRARKMPRSVSCAQYAISSDCLTVTDRHSNQSVDLNEVTRLALEHMLRVCPDKSHAVKGTAIVEAVKAQHAKLGGGGIASYEAVGEFFRTNRGGANRRKPLPFYRHLVKNSGRSSMYWLEGYEVLSHR